jgi:glycolate oxidase FAD binding subunit
MQPLFQEALPAAWTRPGTAADAVDDIVPSVVATPRTIDELETVIALARARRLAVIIAGGATALSLGNRPRALDVVVSMRAMCAVVERTPEDMTVTVDAGATLAELARALASDGQRIALDAGDPERQTLGGLVATNASGGLAYGFGTPRDLVLGMTVVDARARVLQLGGRVVKNVAGYDLVRLFTGSFGSLGAIARLTLRTHPLPDSAVLAICHFADARELETARATIFQSELPLAAFDAEVTRSGTDRQWRLVLRLEGTAAEIDYQKSRCADFCPAVAFLDPGGWRSPILLRESDDISVRVGVLPDRAVAVAERLCDELPDVAARVAMRLGDGTLRVCAEAPPSDALAFIDAARRVAASVGATAVLERIPSELKARLDVWGAPPAGFALMRQLKTRFDPDAVFAPGRFVGGL